MGVWRGVWARSASLIEFISVMRHRSSFCDPFRAGIGLQGASCEAGQQKRCLGRGNLPPTKPVCHEILRNS